MKHIALIAILVLSVGSCIKFDLHKTSHPDQGCLYLTTEWSKRTVGITIPDTREVDVGPAHTEFTGTPAEHALPLLNEGGYQLRVYTPAEKISVKADIASVATNADGYLDPLPGWLFTYTQHVDVVKDVDLHLTAPMVQQVRPVKLTLHAPMSDTAMLASVTAVMDGLAGELNIATGTLGTTSGSTIFSFVRAIPQKVVAATTKAETKADTKVPYAEAYIRLLGTVATAKQTITLKVIFKDGSSAVIENDLTAKMIGFNTGKHITLELDAEIEIQKTEAGFTAVINNWDVYKSEIIAD